MGVTVYFSNGRSELIKLDSTIDDQPFLSDHDILIYLLDKIRSSDFLKIRTGVKTKYFFTSHIVSIEIMYDK